MRSVYTSLDQFQVDRKYIHCRWQGSCTWNYPIEDITLGELLSVALGHFNSNHRWSDLYETLR